MPDWVERCEIHGRVTKWRTSVLDKKTGKTVQVGPVHESLCPECQGSKGKKR